MDQIINFVQDILGLGATVVLPIMITLVGLFFRMKPLKALKAGLVTGVGYAGLMLVVNSLIAAIQPATDYYAALGSGFSVVDLVGAFMGALWSAPFAFLLVPIGVTLNLLLIKTTKLRVLNVDIWNYIHFLLPGVLAWSLWDNFWLGLGISVILSVVSLFLAQKVAPVWQKQFKLEGTTCSTLGSLTIYLLLNLVDKVIDHIPGLNKIDIKLNEKGVDSRWTTLGEPIFISLIIGMLLGILTKQTYDVVLTMGIGMAVAVYLTPRMSGIMMEGLSSISVAVKSYTKERVAKGKDILIGMDVATGLGDPVAIMSAVLSLPISVALTFVLPGVNFFPISLIIGAVWSGVIASFAAKGNLFRAVIYMTIISLLTIGSGLVFQPEWRIAAESLGIAPAEVSSTVGYFDVVGTVVALAHKLIGG